MHSDADIAHLKSTKYFRKRYGKHLRKEIRPPASLCQGLDDWFVKYKCSASIGSRPAEGRLDPRTTQSLFTAETKDALDNCKAKAHYLQDPRPLQEMYVTIPPNPNSPHGLNEYLSKRGESSLESFHLLLAHFGNNGMRDSLADNLNLTGTARFNLVIRHKLRIAMTDENTRSRIPAGWEGVPSFLNHSELAYVNTLAIEAGIDVPFPYAEKLVPDTGELFFPSTYTGCLKRNQKYTRRMICVFVSDVSSLPWKLKHRYLQQHLYLQNLSYFHVLTQPPLPQCLTLFQPRPHLHQHLNQLLRWLNSGRLSH